MTCSGCNLCLANYRVSNNYRSSNSGSPRICVWPILCVIGEPKIVCCCSAVCSGFWNYFQNVKAEMSDLYTSSEKYHFGLWQTCSLICATTKDAFWGEVTEGVLCTDVG